MDATIPLYGKDNESENNDQPECETSLLEDLDSQQNDVLEKLDELNEQIELLLSQVGKDREKDAA